MTSTTGTKPIHIFKPGRHTAMSGRAQQFAQTDLQAIAEVYDPAKHESPLVIGHPKHDLPAYGWVQGLTFSDGSDGLDAGLWAAPAQVNPDFADMVAAGAFKKISAAFYSPDAPNNPAPGNYYLRHVGFLGAQPPAVKGLRNPSFADEEAGVITVEFGEDDSSTPPEKEPKVTEEEAARLRAENEAQAARIAQLESDARREREARVHAEHTAFADDLVAQGRLLPAAKPVIVATLNHLAQQTEPVEFADGDTKAPLIDTLKAALQQAPKGVEFSEMATRKSAAGADETAFADPEDAAFAESADPERMKQHQAIKAYMAQHKVDYATAAAVVLK